MKFSIFKFFGVYLMDIKFSISNFQFSIILLALCLLWPCRMLGQDELDTIPHPQPEYGVELKGSIYDVIGPKPKTALRPAFASLWIGRNFFSAKTLGGSRDGLGERRASSFEAGFMVWAHAWRLNRARTLGITAGAGITYVQHALEKDVQWTSSDNRVSASVGTVGRRSYVNYGELRVPVLLSQELTPRLGGILISVGLTPLLRSKPQYHWMPTDESDASELKTSLHSNRIGLDATLQIAFRYVTMTAQCGLVPVSKMNDGTKLYSNSITIGLNLWDVFFN